MEILQRYTNPTRYELAKYGQIWQHEDKYFIQVSKNPEIAHWLTFGEFLEKCYQDSILSDDFISKHLSMYEFKNNDSVDLRIKKESV